MKDNYLLRIFPSMSTDEKLQGYSFPLDEI